MLFAQLLSIVSRVLKTSRSECFNPKTSLFTTVDRMVLIASSEVVPSEFSAEGKSQGITPKCKKLSVHSVVQSFNVRAQTSQSEDISRLSQSEVITTEIIGGDIFKYIEGHRTSCDIKTLSISQIVIVSCGDSFGTLNGCV